MDWISFFAGVGSSAAFAAVATVFILNWAQKGIDDDAKRADKAAEILLEREQTLLKHWNDANSLAKTRNLWLERIHDRLGE